jgi:glycosyltransferase involved in cell wall biosynthesis
MKSISIFIPAYNAEKTLRDVIERIPAPLWKSIKQVYLINDGSSDDTGSLIAACAREYPRCTPLQQPVNRGYGATVKTGLHSCRHDGCDYAVCLHADGQYPPELIDEGVRKMESGAIDLLQGSRIASNTALSGGMPLYKYVCGRILTKLENRIFNLAMTDFHSGFLLYGRCLLDAMVIDRLSDSFDFDLEMIACARKAKFTIGEFPIPTRYADEKSYLNPFLYGVRVLGVLVGYVTGKYNGMLQQHRE